MSEIEQTKSRLTKVELTLMHLQNDYEKLNEVVIEQATSLEQLRAMLARLTSQIESAKSGAAPPRDAEDERPPHY